MPRKRVPRVRVCEWCGNLIGPDRGPAAKTCSEECQRDRNNAKEKARYQRVKETAEWKETRADYIERVKQKLSTDKEFAEDWYARHRANTARHQAKVNADPARREQALQDKRERMRRLAARINANPATRAAKLEKQRAWYRSLSKEDIERIYYEPLRQRNFERNFVERLNVAAARAAESTKINTVKRAQSLKPWRAEQVQYVREHYATTSAADIAAHIGRSTKAVQERAFAMGLVAKSGRVYGTHVRDMLRWSLREDAALRKWYGPYTAEELAYALDRTLYAVKARIQALRLTNSRRVRRVL